MENKNYIVAAKKPWNINRYHETIKRYSGEWCLITTPEELTVEKVKSLDTNYIFFPDWSYIVPSDILNVTTCVCFHETNLPCGRGGSPVQNLIANGYRDTVVTAFKMVDKLDAGPIYMQRPLSLEGLAEEIFIRTSYIVADMIKEIATGQFEPKEQNGEATIYKRRTPKQSEISSKQSNLTKLFDHIRMLDADGYPNAYFEIGNFRYEISRPALRTNAIVADIHITKINVNGND